MDHERHGWLRDAALATALAVAFLAFTGYMRLQAKYHRWAVPFELADVGVHTYMLESLLPVSGPFFLFVLLFVASYLWGHHMGLGRLRVNLLGIAAITALLTFWSRLSFLLPAGGWVPPMFPYIRLSVASIFLFVVLLAVFAWPILRAQTSGALEHKQGFNALFAGAQTGAVGLVALVFLFWTLSASFTGMMEAEDTLSGCSVSKLATVEPDPLGDPNRSYVHLVHLDGFHYLRDVEGDRTLAVPDGGATLWLTLRPANPALC